MHRISATLSAALLATAAATAQCPGVSAGLAPWDNVFGYASTFPVEDEGLSAGPIALPFAFPMPGAVGTLDQLWVHGNGEVYLTDSTLGLTEPVDGIIFGIILLAELQGAVGGSARIAVCSRDHDRSFVSGANWSVTVDTTFAGEVRVIWTDLARWSSLTDRYSFQLTLFSSGVLRMDYDAAIPADDTWVGVSVGNAEPSTGGSQDLTTLPTSPATEGILYETFTAATWDLSGQSVFFAPDPTPGFENYTVSVVTPFVQGPCASHSPVGTGCYPIARESFYQLFADSALASAALQGNSLTMNPTANGYSVAWNAGGASGYVAPVLPTDLARTDDGQALIDLTALALPAFPAPGGASTALYVHTNGFVSTTGLTNDNGNFNVPPNDYTPTPLFRNAFETAFWSWHDYNAADLAGGPIRWHHDPALDVLYITWDGVENYSTPVANNPSTIQFQMHLATSATPGRVVIVWQDVDNDTTSTFGSGHLVGYSPAGPSLDPGPITLATALPIVTQPDIEPMTLSAAPRPVINPSTMVTFTANNIPEYLPTSGIYISTMFLSVLPLPGGFDLGLIGAPLCNAYIASLDLDLGGQLTFAPTATWNVLFNNIAFAPGNVIGAQAVSLVVPNSLPNGQNAFGMTVSNGVVSVTQVN
ncbi:MAG: hypothetical protein JNL08_16845 [Planctomycetes bacterium]|nr:hypothetical protein [Planctomycetota bacterium]